MGHFGGSMRLPNDFSSGTVMSKGGAKLDEPDHLSGMINQLKEMW